MSDLVQLEMDIVDDVLVLPAGAGEEATTHE